MAQVKVDILKTPFVTKCTAQHGCRPDSENSFVPVVTRMVVVPAQVDILKIQIVTKFTIYNDHRGDFEN